MKSWAPTARAAASTSASVAVGPAVGDVVAHGAGEQERLLRHVAEPAAVRAEVELGERHAVDQHPARGRVVEAGDQLDDRRLAGAGLADQRHGLGRPGCRGRRRAAASSTALGYWKRTSSKRIAPRHGDRPTGCVGQRDVAWASPSARRSGPSRHAACCHVSNTWESCWIGEKNWSRYRRKAISAPVGERAVLRRAGCRRRARRTSATRRQEQDEREVEGDQALRVEPGVEVLAAELAERPRRCAPRGRRPARPGRPTGSPAGRRSPRRCGPGPGRRPGSTRGGTTRWRRAAAARRRARRAASRQSMKASRPSTPTKLRMLTMALISPVWSSCDSASTSVVMRVMIRPAISRS